MASRDHGDPGDAPSVPPPLTAIVDATRPSAAEEARSIAASTNTATLASLTAAGDPRASLAIVAPTTESDPLASGRITLAGVVERPVGDESRAARDAHLAAVAAAKYYVDYSDFTLWVLRVQRVRWVGGYGRMDSASAADYAAATADPVRPQAGGAISHLNADHPESLVEMARALGGYPDTTSAVCTGIDRYGLDLRVDTPRGIGYTRVGFGAPLSSADELRSAAVDLVARARGA